MRRFYTLLIVFVWVLCAFAQKREVRAVWVATIGGIDWPRSYAQSPASAEKQKKDLVDMLDKLQAAGINTVLFRPVCVPLPSTPPVTNRGTAVSRARRERLLAMTLCGLP